MPQNSVLSSVLLHLPETEVVISKVYQSGSEFGTLKLAKWNCQGFIPMDGRLHKSGWGKPNPGSILPRTMALTPSQDYSSLLLHGFGFSHLGIVCNPEGSLGLTAFFWWTGGIYHQEDLCIVLFGMFFLDQSAFQTVSCIFITSLLLDCCNYCTRDCPWRLLKCLNCSSILWYKQWWTYIGMPTWHFCSVNYTGYCFASGCASRCWFYL